MKVGRLTFSEKYIFYESQKTQFKKFWNKLRSALTTATLSSDTF